MRVYAILSILPLSILLFTVSLAVPAHAASIWNVQTVDVNAAGYGNGYCPIVVDSNSNPHIAYTGHSPPNIYDIVRYASWNGSGWSIQEIPYGTPVDLVLDSNDNPHILYETGVHGGLMYASWTGSKWLTQTVTVNTIVYASLALDSYENPRIVYSIGKELKYASWTGSNWSIQTIDSIDEGFVGSLALDSNNTPYIMYSPSSYADYSQPIGVRAINVKLATYQNSSWIIQTVPLPPPTGDYGNMVLDSKGYPHFITTQRHFFSSENMTLLSTILYASWNGTAWETQAVISNVNSNLSFELGFLALDSHDFPHFNYITSSGELMYVSWRGTDWNIQPVDTNIPARGPCYLAVDSKGNPHISYRGIGPDQSGNGRIATIVYATANATDFTQPSSSTQDSPIFSALPLVLTAVIIGTVVIVVVYVYKRKLEPYAGNKH